MTCRALWAIVVNIEVIRPAAPEEGIPMTALGPSVERLPLADWSRPVFADERPVYTRLPPFGFGPRRRQTAVTLNRSQRSSTCCGLSFSARSLRSPLRSKIA